MSVSLFSTCTFRPASSLLLIAVLAFAILSNSPFAASQDSYVGSAYHDEDSDDGPYEQHHGNDGHYGGSIAGICLESQYTTADLNQDPQILKFRCCEPEDAPDYCVNNSTYPVKHKKSWRHDDSNTFIGTVLNPEIAAVCKLGNVTDEEPCLLGYLCKTAILRCTINKHASKCNCPFEEGFAFQAKVYRAAGHRALTCAAPLERKKVGDKQNPSTGNKGAQPLPGAKSAQGHKSLEYGAKGSASAGPTQYAFLAGSANYQGAIQVVDTPYGPVQRKGTVELNDGLVADLVTGPVDPADYPDLRFIKSNQLWIRLWEPKY